MRHLLKAPQGTFTPQVTSQGSESRIMIYIILDCITCSKKRGKNIRYIDL